MTIPIPTTAAPTRPHASHAIGNRHAAGRQAAPIAMKYTRPNIGTGMPNITDCGLVSTFPQLTTPEVLHTSAPGW
jgi:hypothetical protein